MIAGVTGHQDLGNDASAAWVRAALLDVILQHRVKRGTTSLAIGADQMFATILVERQIAYTAVVPSAGYESTFDTPADRARYRALLSGAAETVILGYGAPTELAFFEAGKEVVNRSDVLFAVWDGTPAKGLGGTADIVLYARTEGRRVIHLNPKSRTVADMYPLSSQL